MDIRAYLRRIGSIDQGLLNAILQELQEIQPEIKGENATRVHIIKGTEQVDIRQTADFNRHNDRLLLESGDFLLTESDKYVYLEVGTNKRILTEAGDRLLLETGDFLLTES